MARLTVEYYQFEEGILWRIADWTTGRIHHLGHAWTYDQAQQQIEDTMNLPPKSPRPRTFFWDDHLPVIVDPDDPVVILDKNDRPIEGAKVRNTLQGERCQITKDGRVMRGFLD